MLNISQKNNSKIYENDCTSSDITAVVGSDLEVVGAGVSKGVDTGVSTFLSILLLDVVGGGIGSCSLLLLKGLLLAVMVSI